jgi:CheY-like chemotaxis protein
MPLPSRVFVDLKLPYVHGLGVFAETRRDSRTDQIPPFILTSSSERLDRDRARALGIQGYLVKPPTRKMQLAGFDSLAERGGAPGVSIAADVQSV